VNRASIDNKPVEPEIVVTHLMEGSVSRSTFQTIACFVTDFRRLSLLRTARWIR